MDTTTPAAPANDAWIVLAVASWADAGRMAQTLAIVNIAPVTVGSLGATMSVRASQLAVARVTLRDAGFAAHLVERQPTP